MWRDWLKSNGIGMIKIQKKKEKKNEKNVERKNPYIEWNTRYENEYGKIRTAATHNA